MFFVLDTFSDTAGTSSSGGGSGGGNNNGSNSISISSATTQIEIVKRLQLWHCTVE